MINTLCIKMNKLVLVKRTVFWVEVVLTIAVLCLGVFLILRLFFSSNNLHETTVVLIHFIGYLVFEMIKKIKDIIGAVLFSLFWFSLYVASLFYFAQTETEKKVFKYIAPVSVIAILTTSIGVVGSVMVGLSNPGAGH